MGFREVVLIFSETHQSFGQNRKPSPMNAYKKENAFPTVLLYFSRTLSSEENVPTGCIGTFSLLLWSKKEEKIYYL